MVKFKIEIPEVPRREIDRLEDSLDKLLYKREDDRWECSWKDYIDENKEIPFADIWIKYRLDKFSETIAVEIDARGTIKEGSFKVAISVNIPDPIYGQMEQVLVQEAPYIGKLLEKQSKIRS